MPTLTAVFRPERFGETHSLLEVRRLAALDGSDLVERAFHVYVWDGCWQIVEDMLGCHGYLVTQPWSYLQLSQVWTCPLQVANMSKKRRLP